LKSPWIWLFLNPVSVHNTFIDTFSLCICLHRTLNTLIFESQLSQYEPCYQCLIYTLTNLGT
jgi:hypothetical protein